MSGSAARVWAPFALVAAPVALAAGAMSCAAIGGLGDFREVACVGACDDGGSGSDAPVEAAANGAASFVTIGGGVSGLRGSGLILRNNGTDDLPIPADGTFVFPAKVRSGDAYAVTVSSQPSNPAQTCVVTSGAGNARGVSVSDVSVACSTGAYTVGGTVIGLGAAGLVLTDNGADDLAIPMAGGPFTFQTKVASGAPFAVAVKAQPAAGGPCIVSGGTGTIGVTSVSSVVVNCAPGTYTVGGTVTGLTGTVVLQNGGANDLALTSNGSFAFPQTLKPGATYAVTVRTKPGYPPRSQTCAIANGAGTMGTANVTNVAITCITDAFTIGGTLSGLLGGTLVLNDNGADPLSLTANGPFTFATPVQSGNAFAVTVGTQPPMQSCVITNGSGTATSAKVTSVVVSCAFSSPCAKDADCLPGSVCKQGGTCAPSCGALDTPCAVGAGNCCYGLNCEQVNAMHLCQKPGGG